MAAAVGAASLLLAVTPVATGSEGRRTTGSDAPFVHRLNLLNELGEDPTSDTREGSDLFSLRGTCGRCHDYDTIRSGWHFNAPDPTAPAGRPGEPWLLVDEITGSQIPVSSRPWKGTWRPEQVGLTDWEFVKRFGRHMPGGGLGDPKPKRAAQEEGRWAISGRFAIDCMACHTADNTHRQAERQLQIEEENFRWIHLATSGLARVVGAARRMPDDYDPLLGRSPTNPDAKLPTVVFDASRFDANGQVFFNVTRRPSANRCSFCHTTNSIPTTIEPDTHNNSSPLAKEPDVHMAAGMTCTDCHTNGLDHKIVRGYEAEARERAQPALAAFSCQGCHLGDAEESFGPNGIRGRHRAPRPRHAGLPPIHFDKLSCTACHSGPWPQENVGAIQTSLAHELGILNGRHTRGDTLPYIQSPVFLKQASDGKIAPHKVVWPAFWARRKDGALTILPPDGPIGPVATSIRKKGGLGKSDPLGAQQIVEIMKAFKSLSRGEGEVVYIAGGRLYRLDRDGTLHSDDHEAAQPYTWPLAHNVRRSAQSLGVRGCTDCHSKDGSIFFGTVAARAPSDLGTPLTLPMHRLLEHNVAFEKLFDRAFRYRGLFKIVCSAAAVILALIVVLYTFIGLAGVLRAVGWRP